MKRTVLLLCTCFAWPAAAQVGDLLFRDGYEPTAQISVAPVPAFAPRLVGSASAPLTITLTNDGGSTVDLSEVASSGANAADFPLDLTGTQFTLEPTASTTLAVTFAPLGPWQPGTRVATLDVIGNVQGGVVHVAETGIGATCAGPVPAARSGGGCGDADLDGLNDTWEDDGYVDVDNSGTLDAADFLFPTQAPYLFSAVTHVGTGNGQAFPTVVDPTVPIGASAIVVTIAAPGTIGVATFTYTVNGGAASPPAPVLPVVDLDGNLRLMFYIGNFISGDTYSFTTAMGSAAAIADRDVPNILVQYDYMDWDAPGIACAVDSDCRDEGGPGTQLNASCHDGYCNHRHAPGDPLFRKVVDAFAAHGIRLYIDPVHEAVPHAQVITWNKAGTNGGAALCAGYVVVAGDIANGGAVNFHDVKYRPGARLALEPFRRNLFHYAVLSHFHTCLTDNIFAPLGNCNQCPSDRATPMGQPTAGSSGQAELPGNDFVTSLAVSLNNPLGSVPTNPFLEEGVFMHELGHNLGLHHAGDNANSDSIPNYLSVMNNKYVTIGIQHAASAGSTLSLEPLRELDYSEHALRTIEENHLDEQAGASDLAAGYTGIVRFFNYVGGPGVGPESGPINWDGEPAVACVDAGPCTQPSFTGVCLASGYCEVRTDLNGILGESETMTGYRDWDHDAGPSGVGGGVCASSDDCRINSIRSQIHDLIDTNVDPHEPCLNGRCQSLWLNFQGTPWGKADAAAPEEERRR